MAKNIPITVRVSKGLFGQKVSEPVLNVGQAGVSGNNSTRNIPSPAKQVSADSTGKRLLEGQANVTFGSKEPDTVIPGTPPGTANMDNYKKTYNKQMPPGWTPSKEETAKANKIKADAKAKDAASGTPPTVKKGKDTEQTEGIEVFNTGSAKTSYWRRQDDRAVTHTSRKKKAADIKLAKLEAKEKGLKGKNKRDHINNAKNKAKKEMWETRQAGYKGSRDAAVNQSQQSTAIGDEVKGVNVDPNDQQALTIADVKVNEQPEYELKAKMKAKKNKVNDESNKNPATGKAAGAMANTTSNEVQQVENTEGSSASTTNNKENVETPAGKKANGFFAKKSPLKMKYFK